MKRILLVALILLALPAMSFAVSPQKGNTNSSSSTAISQAGSNSGGNTQQYSSPSIPMQPQPIYPYLQQLLPGMGGDVTKDMPNFYQIKPLSPNDEVIKVVAYTRGGRVLGFSRMEDVDEDLLNLVPEAISKFGQADTRRIRFKVYFKMSSKSIGAGGGGDGSAAGFSGGMNPIAMGANASVMPGVSINTSDPKFIIKFYLIK